MKIFIFSNVLRGYYNDGIAGVIAYDIDHATEMLSEAFPEYKAPWVEDGASNVQEFELSNNPEPKICFYRYGSE